MDSSRTALPATTGPEPVAASVRVERLSKTYPDDVGLLDLLRHPFQARRGNEALCDVRFEARAGEIFGILGPNGAGKTTLLKILVNLVLPSSGSVVVEGHSLASEADEVRGSIGFVPSDERGFFWRLSGLENLRFFGALADVPATVLHERIAFHLDLFGLTAQAHRRFATYSSGQKKAFAIVRGLVPDPPVVLFDEATNHLDPLVARRLKEYVRDELSRRANKTILWATHRLEEVGELCDRVALLAHGRLLFEDTTEEFLRLRDIRSANPRGASLEDVFRTLVAEGSST